MKKILFLVLIPCVLFSQGRLGTAEVKVDGTTPLTADWDAGSYKIQADSLASDVGLRNSGGSYLKGSVGIGTSSPQHQISIVGATPTFNIVDSDVNKLLNSAAQASDTASIKLDASQTFPTVTFSGSDGDQWQIYGNTLDMAIFSGAGGGNYFDQKMGIQISTMYHTFTIGGSTPTFNMTDSDVNKIRTSTATATDTASFSIDVSDATFPIVKFVGGDGDNWQLYGNTSDQALFQNAGGGYVFDNTVYQLGAVNAFRDTSVVNDSYGFTASNISAYVHGMEIKFQAGVANTGACTLQINALGAKGLKSLHDQDPADNYIEVGSWVVCIYDTVGTDFWQIVSPDANP
jgi:hypothetical protein